MSVERVRAYLKQWDLDGKVQEFDVSSATVEEAALAVGCEPRRIAKTMSFLVEDRPVLVVMAGDARIDNARFKNTFQQKAVMIPGDRVEALTGFAPGGVCPFAATEGVPVYLDESLKRFEVVYPSGGSGASAVGVTLRELETASQARGWVEISKLKES